MKKLAILVLCFALICTLLTGCSGEKKSEDDGAEKTEVEAEEDKDVGGKEEDGNKENNIEAASSVTKIGTIGEVYYCYDIGLAVTGDDGKKYIVSADGKNMSEEGYERISYSKGYFTVLKEVPEINGAGDFNCRALVDVNGNVILPGEYFSFDVLNERFIVAHKATEVTDKETGYLYVGYDFFGGEHEGTYLAGEWGVYDLVNESFLESFTGTEKHGLSARGNFIFVQDKNWNLHQFRYDGTELSDYEKVFSNGAYRVIDPTDRVTTVYDAEDNVLFEVDASIYAVYDSTGNYFTVINSTDEWFLMDESGSIVSDAFDYEPDVYGNYVLAGESLYTLDGKKIEGKYTSFYNSVSGKADYAWSYDSEEYVLFDAEGNILASFQKKDNEGVDASYFVVYKENEDGDFTYYSFVDKDFTIVDGYGIGDGLVAIYNSDKHCEEVIDIFTNEIIISGYEEYEALTMAECTYIYAMIDNTTDIYVYNH